MKNWIGLVICILMVIVGIHMISTQMHSARDYVEVQALVKSRQTASRTGGSIISHRYNVEYVYNNTKYTNTYDSERSLSSGDIILIKILKDNPNTIEQDGSYMFIAALMIPMGIIYSIQMIRRIKEGDESY